MYQYMVWGVEEVVYCWLEFCTRYLKGTDSNEVVFFCTLNLRKVWTDLDEILYRGIHRKCCGKNLILILKGPLTAFILLPMGRRAKYCSVRLLTLYLLTWRIWWAPNNASYFYYYVYVFLLYVYVSSSYQLALFGYPDWGFPVLFPQL